MNHNILRLANVLTVGFMIVAGFLLYWQVIDAHTLTSDVALNRTRLSAAESRNIRGRILDRNGAVLARDETRSDGVHRLYTTPSLVHVVGYHSARFGNSAIEDRFDDYLRGTKGLAPLDLVGNRLLNRPAVGADVVLTLDARLQAIADESLGSDKGALVALNPRTGEVLAMVSQPYFDPNRMERDWDSLRNDDRRPLLNRAAQGLYTPGSSFKTITLATALDARVTRPDEQFIYDMKVNERGQYYHDLLVKGFRVYDANHEPTEDHRSVLDLAHAYAVSCNVAFADLGLRLGARGLTEGAERFGIGSEVPIEIPAAASRMGSDGAIPKGDPALASTAFGQGELLVSPLQMALATAAVANGGVVPKPHVVAGLRDAESGDLPHALIEEWRRAMSPETAKTVAGMMVVSAEEGWAKTGRIPGVQVAAKTGTAETGGGEESHAWFIAYAPAENPLIAVAVIKEHAGGGATQAGPVAKKVIEEALRLYR